MFVRGTCHWEAVAQVLSICEVYVCKKNGIEVYKSVYFAGLTMFAVL